MEEITLAHLHDVTGGGAAGETGWQVAKRVGGKVGGKLFAAYNAYSTGADTLDAWKKSRAAGDGVLKAGAKATGAGIESATWPIVPMAREAFKVSPAY